MDPPSSLYSLGTPVCKYNESLTHSVPFVEVEAKPGVAPEETSVSLAKDSGDCQGQEGAPRVKLSALEPSARQEERQRQVSI